MVFDFFFHPVFSKCYLLRPLSSRAIHAPPPPLPPSLRRTRESRSGRAAVFPEETFFYANKIIEIIRRANVPVLTCADKSIRYVDPTCLRAHAPKTSATHRIHVSGTLCRKSIFIVTRFRSADIRFFHLHFPPLVGLVRSFFADIK